MGQIKAWRAQALHCLVNILRALVDWYIRAVPSLNSVGPAEGGPGEEAPRTDWQPLTSKQSQDVEALAARASGQGSRPEVGTGSGQGNEGAAADAPLAEAAPPAAPDADVTGALWHRCVCISRAPRVCAKGSGCGLLPQSK